jgi:hypothetical protein
VFDAQCSTRSLRRAVFDAQSSARTFSARSFRRALLSLSALLIMHPRTEELLKHLDSQHERLRRAVDDVPRDKREVKPSAERWSVAEVVEHLSIVETRIARLFSAKLTEARAAGLGRELDESPVVGTIDMDRLLDRTRRVTAAEAALPTGKLDCDAAWAAHERARDAICMSVRGADGLALGDVVHPHPVLGTINLYQWIAFVGGHEARHAAQVMELRDLLSS